MDSRFQILYPSSQSFLARSLADDLTRIFPGSVTFTGQVHMDITSAIAGGFLWRSDRPGSRFILPIIGPSQHTRLKGWISQLRSIEAAILIAVFSECEGSLDRDAVIESGADDVIYAPIEPDILRRIIGRFGSASVSQPAVEVPVDKNSPANIIGASPSIQQLKKRLKAMADTTISTLITGETGTGKELCARALHYLGPRAGGPFVPVQCSAIPVELFENEMFGHESGAYTGAHSQGKGYVAAAEGGTLFLDEINSLPPTAQVKLLRFLQERTYYRLGSSVLHKADVRLVFASNVSLEEAMRHNAFRQDLYYRITETTIEVPPLRDRREDIPLLTEYFLSRARGEQKYIAKGFSRDAMNRLISYDWPGNIRELENVVKSASVYAATPEIGVGEIEARVPQTTILPYKVQLAEHQEKFEQTYLRNILTAYRGNISQAAIAAGLDRKTLRALIQRHDLRIP